MLGRQVMNGRVRNKPRGMSLGVKLRTFGGWDLSRRRPWGGLRRPHVEITRAGELDMGLAERTALQRSGTCMIAEL